MVNTQAGSVEFKWWFKIMGGIKWSRTEFPTVEELLNELERGYVEMFATQLGVNPDWRSVAGESLPRPKLFIFQLRRVFHHLGIIASSESSDDEKGFSLHDLMDNLQGLVAWSCVEANYEGQKALYEEILNDIDAGRLRTKEDWDDLYQAFMKQHDIWNEVRQEKRELELKLDKSRDEQRKHEILRDAPSEDRERFTQIVTNAKRTKKNKVVFSDVERRCKTEFPNGIAGRKVDDKYVKELCILWRINLK